MARADRLLRLLDALRSLPAPVTATQLAEAMEVTPRSIYRDIGALRAAGARIDGEAGWGYALAEDPALPPQSFDRLEIEALLLGLSEVRQSGDADLAAAADRVAAKIVATLPERQAREAAHAALMVYRHHRRDVPGLHLPLLRQATWEEREVDLGYRDEHGRVTARRVQPLAIVYRDATLVLLAWCRLRVDFRQFRVDRIDSVTLAEASFRPHRVTLLRDYVARLTANTP